MSDVGKARGFTSVMAQRLTTDPASLDDFPTPPWAGRAGAELIKAFDPAADTCWEPACNRGTLAHALRDYFREVACSDIHNYGVGWLQDFLAEDPNPTTVADWIATNPPFKDAEAFVRLGLQRARRGVAMLLRSSFKEGVGRYALHTGAHPITVTLPFAERVPMVKGCWDPEASTATAYAWFIWMQPAAIAESPFATAIAEARAMGCALELIIKPGAKKRLTRPSDYQFAKARERDENILLSNWIMGDPDR